MGKQVNTLDPTKLQMLVDGALDHQQRSDFLRSLDDDFKAWREIAIGFLEKQVLDEALAHCQMAEPSLTSSSRQVEAETGPRRVRSAIFWLALAASMLVGLWLGSILPTGNSPTEIADNSRPSEDIVVADKSLPLVDALARSVRPVSLDTQREFLRAGYVLNESHELADVTLPTGDLIQMPIRQFEIKYLGNAAFQ